MKNAKNNNANLYSNFSPRFFKSYLKLFFNRGGLGPPLESPLGPPLESPLGPPLESPMVMSCWLTIVTLSPYSVYRKFRN